MNATDAVKKLLLAGWTQARIANEIGCQQPNIQKIKAGRATTPDRELQLRALANRIVRTKAYKEAVRVHTD